MLDNKGMERRALAKLVQVGLNYVSQQTLVRNTIILRAGNACHEWTVGSRSKQINFPSGRQRLIAPPIKWLVVLNYPRPHVGEPLQRACETMLPSRHDELGRGM